MKRCFLLVELRECVMERMWVSGVAWGGGSYKALGSFGAAVGAAVVFALFWFSMSWELKHLAPN